MEYLLIIRLLLFRMKYIIKVVVCLLTDTYNYFNIPKCILSYSSIYFLIAQVISYYKLNYYLFSFSLFERSVENINYSIFNNFILRSFRGFLSVRSRVKWRPAIWHSMKISWLASAWYRFLLRGAFEQSFILVLILMLLLSVILIAFHMKWNLIIFTAMVRFS